MSIFVERQFVKHASVNGRVLEDIVLDEKMNPTGSILTGSYNGIPIQIRRQLRHPTIRNLLISSSSSSKKTSTRKNTAPRRKTMRRHRRRGKKTQ